MTVELGSVSLPKELLNRIDVLVKESQSYVSRADFCRSAVRKLIAEETV